MTDTEATVTVRIIKSFEYKNFRSLVFRDVDLHRANLGTLREMVWESNGLEGALTPL